MWYMIFPHKDLLDISSLSLPQITLLLDTAVTFRQILNQKVKKAPSLRGKTIVNLFLEPSTRTRTSFELAGKRLSADVINISASSSSLTKGETLHDTLLTLEAMNTDILVLRHYSAGVARVMASRTGMSIVNAGDGMHAHPTQTLLDLLTIRDSFQEFSGLRVMIIGDILHSRVARSNIEALLKVGAKITLVAPPTLLPPDKIWDGVRMLNSLDEEDGNPYDVIYLLRIQRERQKANFFPSIIEYTRHYGLSTSRMESLAHADTIVLHPGPINRDIELSSALADGDRSRILDQVTNGVAVRMAVLYLLSRGPGDEIAD